MVDDLVSRVLSAITERERIAREAAALQWDSEDGWGRDGRALTPHIGVIHEEQSFAHILANDPPAVLRLYQSLRDIVTMNPVSAPIVDENECFHGFQARDCGEHRTVGTRAWCHDCSEWCYPSTPCARCHGVSDVLLAVARGLGIEEDTDG